MFDDIEGALDKASVLIAQAAREGAKLVVFPEAFISGYRRDKKLLETGQSQSPGKTLSPIRRKR